MADSLATTAAPYRPIEVIMLNQQRNKKVKAHLLEVTLLCSPCKTIWHWCWEKQRCSWDHSFISICNISDFINRTSRCIPASPLLHITTYCYITIYIYPALSTLIRTYTWMIATSSHDMLLLWVSCAVNHDSKTSPTKYRKPRNSRVKTHVSGHKTT